MWAASATTSALVKTMVFDVEPGGAQTGDDCLALHSIGILVGHHEQIGSPLFAAEGDKMLDGVGIAGDSFGT